MGTKAANVAAIEERTGRTWEAWVSWLDEHGAGGMTHAQIATLVEGDLRGQVDNPGWWAQGVTVAYEQHTGRRLPGQRPDGTFEVTVTRLVDEGREVAFEALTQRLAACPEVQGQQVSGARTSITARRSYWRCELGNGSRVQLAVELRGERTQLGITHARLAAPEEVETWRAYWRAFLAP